MRFFNNISFFAAGALLATSNAALSSASADTDLPLFSIIPTPPSFDSSSSLRTASSFAIPAPILARINAGARLIQLTEESTPTWMNEREILKLYKDKKHFMDVTDEAVEHSNPLRRRDLEQEPTVFAPPLTLSRQSQVTPLTSQVSISSMTTFLTTFSGFTTRFYKTQTGSDSSEWLYQQILAISKTSPVQGLVTVERVVHAGYTQSSIVARIKGSKPNAPLVILGAHQDSINGNDPLRGSSPGADDDGTGTTSLFETFRILVSSGFQPIRPIEIHFYAGEEAGLLGSQTLARNYKALGTPVAGMMQLDMTGYLPPSSTNGKPVIAVITDYTSTLHNGFLRLLISEYTDAVPGDDICGYGCSDHASWNRLGFAAVYPFEGVGETGITPYIHTAMDGISTVNFEHVGRFAKIGIAWAVELGMIDA
ncbi:hypothetical protein HDV05_001585 [Chytridiales sp. JEL 0842]|nr:hypothetical protein HDV05_001585 [Chytridiales sp. JEL 0842]